MRNNRAIWADDWFTLLQTVVHPVIQENRKTNQKRVRVAVLDTGVDATHPEIELALSEKRIALHRGFPESLDALNDRHGHGTHGATVLMKTAPDAVIYIARMVDDEGKISDDDQYLEVAKVTSVFVESNIRRSTGRWNNESTLYPSRGE